MATIKEMAKTQATYSKAAKVIKKAGGLASARKLLDKKTKKVK